MGGGGKRGPDNTPIDAELIKAGAFGRFQLFITATIVVGIFSVNLLTHGIGILELEVHEPGYICTDKKTGIKTTCGYEDWCDNSHVDYEIDYKADSENIYNWYTKLELPCKGKLQTSLIAMCCLFGIFLGVFFVPRMGDLVGRKPVLQTALIGSLLPLAMVTFTKSVLVVDIGAFIAGPCIIARMSCGFLLLMEHMPTKQQAAVGAVIMISEGCTQIFWVFFLTVISKDTFYFMYFAMALNLISAIAFFWVPESPRYLYGINDLEKCSQVLAYIAKMNGVQDYSAPKFEVEFDIQVDNVDETKDTQRKSKTGFDGLLEKRGE